MSIPRTRTRSGASPAEGPATLEDVALRAGVSRTTASYVLSQSGSSISEATRQRVFEAARALRYAKSAFVTGFQQGRAHTLGVLVCYPGEPYPSDPVMNRALAGISSAAQAHQYHTLLYTGLPATGGEAPVEAFLDRRVDGLILIAPPLGSLLAAEIVRTHLPCVALCSRHAPPGLSFVDADNRAGARLVVEHLVRLGHRRIAHVARPALSGSSNFEDRRQGYVAGLAEHGLPVDPALITVVDNRDNRAYVSALRALLLLPDPPTAVFCDNDYAALDLLEAASGLGVSVPRDLSVVGFDDSLQAPLAPPPLTTVHQPLQEMGRRAARAVCDLIEGRTASGDACLLVPVELIVRGSTAACPRIA